MTEQRRRITSRLGQPNPPHDRPERLERLTECCARLEDQQCWPSVSRVCSEAGFAEATLRRPPYWDIVLKSRQRMSKSSPKNLPGIEMRVTKAPPGSTMQDLMEKLAVLSDRIRKRDKQYASLQKRYQEAIDKLDALTLPARPPRKPY